MNFDTHSQTIGKLARIFAMVMYLVVLLFSSTNIATASSQHNAINIDIGHTFDWKGNSIKRVAGNAAVVFGDRCIPPCTVNLRVFVTGASANGLKKRIGWLKKAIRVALEKRSKNQVNIVDVLYLV